MTGFWGRVFGHSEAKAPIVQEAEASLSPEQLQLIKSQYQAALKAQGNGSEHLQEHAFVQSLSGLPCSSPEAALVGTALYLTCHGCASPKQSTEDGAQAPAAPPQPGVTLDDVVVAKATCERLPNTESHAFAFLILCHLAALAASSGAAATSTQAASNTKEAHPPTEAATTHSPPQPGAHGARSDASVKAAARRLHDQGIPLEQLVAALKALCTFLDEALQRSTHTTAAAQGGPQRSNENASMAWTGGSLLGGQAADAWVAAAAQGALWVAAGPAASKPAATLDLQGYTRWVKSTLAWHQLLASLLSGVGAPPAESAAAAAAGSPTSSHRDEATTKAGLRAQLPVHLSLPRPPQLLQAVTAQGVSSEVQVDPRQAGLLLHPLAALLLASCMPPKQQREWRLVFTSDKDGKSFNTLMGRLSAVEGATLVLVREAGEGGHLVAGYAPAPWRKSGSFFGDHTSWVATLLPHMQVFTATGANTNFQWCGQGFSQLTNGIGFGGAQGAQTAFALLVDATLDSGQSRPIATFGSPALTKGQVFKVDAVECWCVEPPEEDASTSSSAGAGKKAASVLTKAGVDRAIMEFAGVKVNHSAGLKPDEPIEE